MKIEYVLPKFLAILCVVVFLSGCLPFPYTVNSAPQIIGKLESDGEPIPGATVQFAVKDVACSAPQAETVTDSFGRFSFPKFTDTEYWIPLIPMHKLSIWSLCFKDEQGEKRLWKDATYGPWSTPEEMKIHCDLSRTDDTYLCVRGSRSEADLM